MEMMHTMTDSRVEIDYPRENECMTSRHYTIRIDAPQAQRVLCSIDDSQFHLCRQADGYFWFDLNGCRPGYHHVVAKAMLDNGEMCMSEPRRFKVEYC